MTDTFPAVSNFHRLFLKLNWFIWEIFGHNPSTILVSPVPTGYMLTSFGFPLLKRGMFYRFL